jgi:dTDP-4-dehydrorhamnose reductase
VKILLFGAAGQLGSDLLRVFRDNRHDVVPASHAAFDVCEVGQVDRLVDAVRPEVVVNTAAFHKVEECERQPLRASEVNAVGTLNLARACAKTQAILVHFSTDYVFDGKKEAPYLESDLPSPVNVYGASKEAGERLVACNLERHFILRTCGLYGHAGSSGKGGNFVETMLKKGLEGGPVRVVDDQILTPTATADLALVVNQLIETSAFGLYNVTCEGACSWHDFAREIFGLQKMQVNLLPVKTTEFPSPVRRPAYSVLSKGRLSELGLSMPQWRQSLERYLLGRGQKNQAISA